MTTPYRTYQMPMMAPHVPVSAADRVAYDLERAKRKTGLVRSVVHRYQEANATAALRSTTSRIEAEKGATYAATEALRARSEFETAGMRLRVQGEIAHMVHQVTTEEAVMALHGRLARAQEGMLTSQQAALHAEHGLEATHRHKLLNFDLGAARKAAQLEETLGVMPEQSRRNGAKSTMTLAEALRHRAELRADGQPTEWLDDQINDLAAREGIRVAE